MLHQDKPDHFIDALTTITFGRRRRRPRDDGFHTRPVRRSPWPRRILVVIGIAVVLVLLRLFFPA